MFGELLIYKLSTIMLKYNFFIALILLGLSACGGTGSKWEEQRMEGQLFISSLESENTVEFGPSYPNDTVRVSLEIFYSDDNIGTVRMSIPKTAGSFMYSDPEEGCGYDGKLEGVDFLLMAIAFDKDEPFEVPVLCQSTEIGHMIWLLAPEKIISELKTSQLMMANIRFFSIDRPELASEGEVIYFHVDGFEWPY